MEVNCLINFRYGYECDESKPYSSSRGQAPIDSIMASMIESNDGIQLSSSKSTKPMVDLTLHGHT